jgi:hypothetical protein
MATSSAFFELAGGTVQSMMASAMRYTFVNHAFSERSPCFVASEWSTPCSMMKLTPIRMSLVWCERMISGPKVERADQAAFATAWLVAQLLVQALRPLSLKQEFMTRESV